MRSAAITKESFPRARRRRTPDLFECRVPKWAPAPKDPPAVDEFLTAPAEDRLADLEGWGEDA